MNATANRSHAPTMPGCSANQPLVSIIIPCWNGEAFVGDAINSALAQTYPGVEVIVIDDGSTDDSLDVIRSFGDRVRWETGPNRGACAARNRGLELAHGTYVQFLDADDRLYSRKLERQLDTFQGYDVILCRGREHRLGGSAHAIGRPRHADFFQSACTDILTVVSPLIKANLLREVGGFDTSLPCMQERDLHLRMAVRDARWAFLDEELFEIRKRAESLSSDLQRIAVHAQRVYSRTYRTLESSGGITEPRRCALAEAVLQAAKYAYDGGNFDLCRQLAKRAREMHHTGGMAQHSLKRRLVFSLVGFYYGLELKRRLGASRI